MDERGRVPLPPQCREAFRAGVVLSQSSPDPCILLYPKDEYEAQSEAVKAIPPYTELGRRIRRQFFGKTHNAQLDAQSRVLVPSWMREYASLGKQVRIVGIGEALELWAPENYEPELARIAESAASLYEAMAEHQRAR